MYTYTYICIYINQKEEKEERQIAQSLNCFFGTVGSSKEEKNEVEDDSLCDPSCDCNYGGED